MPFKLKNEYGTVTIENEVIARIAGLAAMDCYGIVGMTAKNVKDGFAQILKRESLTKGIQCSINDESLVVDLHIIVEYGTNISTIAQATIKTVKYKVEKYAGILVEQVNIFVEDVHVDNRS